MKKWKERALGFAVGFCVAFGVLIKLQQGCIDEWEKMAKKNRGMFLLMNQWIRIKQEGNHLSVYFKKNGYKKIAIYGMGYIGIRLVKELKGSGIEVAYGIDRNAGNIYSNVKVVRLEDDLSAVDAIVISLTDGSDEVRKEISEKVCCPVVAIEDILNQL